MTTPRDNTHTRYTTCVHRYLIPGLGKSDFAFSATPSTCSATRSTAPDSKTAADTTMSAAVAVSYCCQPDQQPRQTMLDAIEIR